MLLLLLGVLAARSPVIAVSHPFSSQKMSSIEIDPATYPSARKDESVVDDYHGVKIADPYRWMEDPDAEETQQWVDKLNAVSEPFMAAAPAREQMRAKLTELWDYEKFTCTAKRGDYYYYKYNSGLQNQYVIYQQKSLGEKGEVFLDPNTLSADGTTSMGSTAWTKDGKILAYGLSEKGSDWVTIHFKTAEGKQLSDVVCDVKHSGIAWAPDASGVFYSKYQNHKGAASGTSTEKHELHSVYFHRLGTDCKDDVLVYEDTQHKDYMMGAEVTEDGRYLIIDVSRGCDPFNMLHYYDFSDGPVTGKIAAQPLFTKLDAKYDVIDTDGEHALIMTNKDAPMFKLCRVKMGDAEGKMEEIIGENSRSKLDWIAPIAGDRMVVAYLEDVKTALYVHDLASGARLYQIPLDIGSVSGFFGKKDMNEVFFSFESFLVPTIVYRADFSKLPKEKPVELEELRRVSIRGMDANQFAMKQVFFNSKDGTKVPMFLISRKDLPLDGSTPTILNGYGGFNVADTPYFSIGRLLVVKHFNGLIACANLRGGSEYGEAWHMGGMREKKQNVFDDFIGAAEYLIKEKYTSPAKLAIHGGSNGGLLMGACSQQRPELYGAVINRVGVLDMLRFHKFTVGGAWMPEFGNPDDADDFKFIYKYSPLHQLKMPEGGQWPATLLMTADHDDRVVPSHTLKYSAKLYEKSKEHSIQRKPLLVRVEVKAGHGAGKPTSKIIAELVDMYSFVQRTLDMQWRD